MASAPRLGCLLRFDIRKAYFGSYAVLAATVALIVLAWPSVWLI